MLYTYKCVNLSCDMRNVLKEVSIPMAEYSEDKLPVCKECGSKTQRVFNSSGIRPANDKPKF